MKAEFLKIAGVKSEKAFYKKYPTEAAFFKAHPEAKKSIKKAQAGTIMSGMSSYLQGMQGMNNLPNMQNMMQGQMQSPGVNAGMFPSYDQMYMNMSTEDEQLKPTPDSQPSANSIMKGGMNVIGGMFNAANAMKKQKEELKNARMWADVSGVVKRAAISNQFAEKPKNTWIRQDDQNQIANINQLYPGQGVGTNALARNGARLEDGGMVGGNPTEIQNTYAPNDLYQDLEYEPLYDVNQTKFYRAGGYIPKAQFGIASAGMEGFGQNPYSSLTGSMFNNSGGSQMGSAVGSMFGPFGGLAGGMIGGMLDKTGGKTKDAQQRFQRNMDYIAGIDSTAGIHNQFNSVMEDGGWVSNDWNPQVIAKFGDLDDQDYAQFAHKDEFRAGGHLKAYREPSERAMQTYNMGGELQTHWGGYAEPMSHNPYMPGSGETVVFRGQSHTDSDGKGNTGIGITYGENPVEVERGEPMFEMQSGGNINPETGEPENTGVVFGNMQINKKVAGELNDPELMKIANMYHGKKFKNVGIDLSKQEVKQNKIISKNMDILNSFKVETSIDKAKLAGLQANIEGAKSNLKNIANTKITLANFQNSINDAKEEMSENFGQNISAEDLAKGYIKLDKDPVTMNAKWGGDIFKKAQNGDKGKTFKSEREANAQGYYKGADGKYYRTIKKYSTKDEENKSADALGYVPAGQKQSASGLWGKVTPEQFEETKKANAWFDWSGFDPKDKNDVKNYQRAFNARAKAMGSSASLTDDGDFGEQTVSARIDESKKTEPIVTEEKLTANVEEPEYTPMEEEKAQFPWGLINQGLRFLTPTDQQGLDPRQLAPEMLAKLQNKLEPVNMQRYNPRLDDLYDISYQDVLNENDSDFLTATRSNNLNPAMRASLLGQKYAANSKVLGEQFRANQGMRDKVFSGNRAILNDAEKMNLGLADQQFVRQQQALTNTRDKDLEISKSVADKYAKNKSENRKLSIYENMYPNFRFGQDGRAQNYGLHFFDTTIGGGSKSSSRGGLAEGKEFTYDKYGNIVGVRTGDKDSRADDFEEIESIGKNGKSIKKDGKNSSILKAFKNL
jgi:hypothetical protein